MTQPQPFRIPEHPVISPASFRASPVTVGSPTTPVFQDREILRVTSGRVALALGMQHVGVGADTKVLVPAFHCLAMVLPIAWLGGTPVYYRVNNDLSPDFDDLERKIDDRVRCIIAVHYFGFPTDIEKLTEFASRHSISLIEDCAHAFFGSYRGKQLGSFGDYAILSPAKFLPIFDGGYLLARDDRLPGIPLENGDMRFQLKALINTLEYGLDAGKFGILNGLLRIPFLLKDWLMRTLKKADRPGARADAAPLSVHGSTAFEPEWMHIRMSGVSRWIAAHVSLTRAAGRRRENYRTMLSAFANRDDCRALYPKLLDDVVPYVFPLYIRDGDRVYLRLRELGIPVYRWEGIPENTCDVGTDYKSRLIQLPIHQELSPVDLNRIIQGVQGALDIGRPTEKKAAASSRQ